MPSNLTRDVEDIPVGVAHVTLLLLRRAVAERGKLVKLDPKDPKLGLWLTPEGKVVYRRTRVKKRRPKPLLIHHVDENNNPVKGAFISRLISWIVDGNFTALASNLQEEDLRAAFACGFFRKIGDIKGHERARQAIMEETKRQLIDKHTIRSGGR